MRALLLGVGGMLGHDLAQAVPADVALTALPRAELDVTDQAALAAALARVRPDVVINAAGYTAVDRAEAEAEAAFEVNGAAVGELGRLAAHAGARVVHFSSDYVFDGSSKVPYREDDPPAPLSAYGRSKLAGERALEASGASYLIVRSQWLFGVAGRSFPRTMWERARAALDSRVVNDQTGRPTLTADLARAVWRLITLSAEGTLHIANRGSATWYDVAARVYAAAGVPGLVTPCRTTDYPTPAVRPAYSVLDTSRADKLLGGALPPWEDALARFLSELAAA
jgi:dTDP-4-dehydrorhamnose reductase